MGWREVSGRALDGTGRLAVRGDVCSGGQSDHKSCRTTEAAPAPPAPSHAAQCAPYRRGTAAACTAPAAPLHAAAQRAPYSIQGRAQRRAHRTRRARARVACGRLLHGSATRADARHAHRTERPHAAPYPRRHGAVFRPPSHPRAHLHSEADLLVQDQKQLRDRRVVGARRHLHPLRQHLRAIP